MIDKVGLKNCSKSSFIRRLSSYEIGRPQTKDTSNYSLKSLIISKEINKKFEIKIAVK